MGFGLVSPSLASHSCEFAGRFDALVREVLGDLAEEKAGYVVFIVDWCTGNILCEESVNSTLNIYPASTIKTMIAFVVMKRIDEGGVGLDDMIKITQINADAECDTWNCAHYGRGRKVSVRDLLRDSITISNNIASNQLTDLVGKPYINALADRIGAYSIRIIRKLYVKVPAEPDNPERNKDSAAGLAADYREIVTGPAEDPARAEPAVPCRGLATAEDQQQFESRVPRRCALSPQDGQ